MPRSVRDGRLREPARKASPIPGPSITGRRWREGASEAPRNHHHTKESCDENLQLSFFIWEVVAGTVKIDFDAREAKPGSKGLRNHRDQIPDFSPNKPRSLPLTLPRLQATHAEGTSAYVIDAPRTATGITLVFSMDSPAKVIVERYNAPGGKNRKRKTWSIKEGSTRSRILSFNGLGSEESTIRILVSAPESPEHSESYDVTVRRAATFGTDPTLTALELSDGALTPAFARRGR